MGLTEHGVRVGFREEPVVSTERVKRSFCASLEKHWAAGAALLAGARVRPWAWWGLLAGCVAGLVFVHWLIAQSVFVIGALCPYCMIAWVSTICATMAGLAALAAAGRAPSFLARWAPTIVVGWVGAVALLVATGLPPS